MILTDLALSNFVTPTSQFIPFVCRLGSDRRDARGRANARAFVSKLLVAVSSRVDVGGRAGNTGNAKGGRRGKV